MSKYNFDEIVNRHHSGSAKWNVFDNELPMWVADMDYHVLPEIKIALKERADIDAYGYSMCPTEYFDSYAKWWANRHNVRIKPEELVFCTGVVAAIDSIFKHLLPKGSGVVVFVPVYHVFFHCIKNNDLKQVDSPLVYKDGNYSIDFEQLESVLKEENNKCLLLCNPHNPVGRLWNEEELTKVASLCKKYDVLLISDEIHCDIVGPGYSYTSIMNITNDAIALWSPTKAFNIAGIQASVIACKNDALREEIEEGVGQDDVGEPNYFSAYATIAAFTYGEQWLKECNEYINQNKMYMMEFVRKELPELHLIDNKATYLLWLDASKYTSDSERFSYDLRKQTGLFASPGKQFGQGGEGFLRINIATSLKNVKDACERLKKYVKSLQK